MPELIKALGQNFDYVGISSLYSEFPRDGTLYMYPRSEDWSIAYVERWY